MRRKLVCSATIVVLAFAAFGATADAATEFGDPCTANQSSTTPVTYFALTAIGRPVSLSAPIGGVITKWKTNISPAFAGVVPQSLKVMRLSGPNSVLVVGEASANLAPGPNTVDTRIPVQAGDRLGLYGPSPTIGALFCEMPGPVDKFGGFEGTVGPGQTTTYAEIADEAGIPVAAVIEPDADGDGYGDETQDKCPQSAAVQVACPAVTLSATGAAKKELARITITANPQATVTVKGNVKLGKGKSAKLTGGTRVVAPGTLAKFTLLFPQKLRAALKTLPTKQFLTLKVTVSAPNVAGLTSTKTLKLHLKGQAKPKRHSRKKRA